jgi:hypothetical protein
MRARMRRADDDDDVLTASTTPTERDVLMSDEDDDDFDAPAVDFVAVGLYLAGLQTVCAIVCASVASVLCCWLLPIRLVSAVRTLTCCAATGAALVHRPLRVGRARGLTLVFDALRPSVAVYVLALALQQLAHTCSAAADVGVGDAADPEGSGGSLKPLAHHAFGALMLIAGLMRARAPRSESDVPFALCTASLLLLALLPPVAHVTEGPLCEQPSVYGAVERVARAIAFGCTYAILVYASVPAHRDACESVLCATRSTSASLWIFVVHAWMLPCALAQCALAIAMRMRLTDASSPGADSYDALSVRPFEALSLKGRTGALMAELEEVASVRSDGGAGGAREPELAPLTVVEERPALAARAARCAAAPPRRFAPIPPMVRTASAAPASEVQSERVRRAIERELRRDEAARAGADV